MGQNTLKECELICSDGVVNNRVAGPDTSISDSSLSKTEGAAEDS